jgi:hypothetical protein
MGARRRLRGAMSRLATRVGIPVAMAAAAAAVVWATVAIAATVPRLRVTPGKSGSRSAFTVYFTAPEPSGTHGGTAYRYSVSAAAAAGSRHRGCVGTTTAAPVATRAGEAMAVGLRPSGGSRHWCLGRFHGAVTETISPMCTPAGSGHPQMFCPQFIAIRRLGTFAFDVRR